MKNKIKQCIKLLFMHQYSRIIYIYYVFMNMNKLIKIFFVLLKKNIQYYKIFFLFSKDA
jgi:hypothetical protein